MLISPGCLVLRRKRSFVVSGLGVDLDPAGLGASSWLKLEVPEEEEGFFKGALRLFGVLSSQQHSVLYFQGPPGIMWDCRVVHGPGIY